MNKYAPNQTAERYVNSEGKAFYVDRSQRMLFGRPVPRGYYMAYGELNDRSSRYTVSARYLRLQCRRQDA